MTVAESPSSAQVMAQTRMLAPRESKTPDGHCHRPHIRQSRVACRRGAAEWRGALLPARSRAAKTSGSNAGPDRKRVSPC